MTTSSTTQLDAIATRLKDGAGKLADLLTQHAALTAEWEDAAREADAAGLRDFAEMFRDMAQKLGSPAFEDGRPMPKQGKRRGRPPKPAGEQPIET